jgi:hypothetical protein
MVVGWGGEMYATAAVFVIVPGSPSFFCMKWVAIFASIEITEVLLKAHQTELDRLMRRFP